MFVCVHSRRSQPQTNLFFFRFVSMKSTEKEETNGKNIKLKRVRARVNGKLVAWKFIVQWFGRECKFRGQNSKINGGKNAIRAYVLLNHHVDYVDIKFNLVGVHPALTPQSHILLFTCADN